MSTEPCDLAAQTLTPYDRQRAPDEGLEDLPGKASKDDSDVSDATDFAMPFFDDYTWGSDTCNISRCFGSVRFEECYLEDVIIADCCMTNVIFRGCIITKATWAELDLADLTFEECTFEDHLWRCRSLHGYRVKGKFQGETSLGEDIPPETNMAVWAEQQQSALNAPSIDDETYARRLQAELNGDEAFDPAAQQPSGRDVSSDQASNAKSNPHGKLQSEKVIQSRLFNDWNSPLWKPPGSDSKHRTVKPNKTTKDLAQKDVIAVPKRSIEVPLTDLGQQAPKPVNEAGLPVHKENVPAGDEKQSDAMGGGDESSKKCEDVQSVTTGNPGFPGTNRTVIAKGSNGVYGLPPHLRNKKV